MSLVQPPAPERQPSPGLITNLSSNNPFRNRATSPASASPSATSPQSASDNRPLSRNPFLSTFEEESSRHRTSASDSGMASSTVANGRRSPERNKGDSTADIFSSLSLLDKPLTNDKLRPRAPPRSETIGSATSHRPSRSHEGGDPKLREGPRGTPRSRAPPSGPTGPGSPERENRRPRRNSESSVIDKGSLTEDERRRRERRRKERDAKAKDGRTRDGRVKKPRGIDIIDKLDVTGIYGTGHFHHDGPFDACNPHRNRKRDQRAPMQAFPKDSANNALGGSGPLNKNIDLEQFHGRGTEGFTDYAKSGAFDAAGPIGKKQPVKRDGTFWNPKTTHEKIHGEESFGLGTSTFLEGTPASRIDMQRRDSENEAAMTLAAQQGGLQRKKSLAQRIRGISQPRRDFANTGPLSAGARVTAPEYRLIDGATLEGGPQSAGGASRTNERNPFFDDYDDAYERKGANIKASATTPTEPEPPMSGGGVRRAGAPSSPRRSNGLERKLTSDYTAADDGKATGGGFINRVKSMRGGRRARPDRRDG